MTKKQTLIGISLLLLLTSLSGLLIWTKSQLSQTTLNLILRSTQRFGVLINFDRKFPQKKTTLELQNITFQTKKSHLIGKVDHLTLTPKIKLSWHPIKIVAIADQLNISESESVVSAASLNEKPAHLIDSVFGLFLPLITLELQIKKLEIVPLKIQEAELTTNIDNPALIADNLPNVRLNYQLSINKWRVSQATLAPSCSSSGIVTFNKRTLFLSSAKLNLGFLGMTAEGKYDLETDKWALETDIPAQDINKQLMKDLKRSFPEIAHAEGRVSFHASSQGLGADIKTINSEGFGALEKIKIQLDHPKAKGIAEIQFYSDFKVSESSESNTQILINLDNLNLPIGSDWLKRPGIPLRVGLNLIGKEQKWELQNGTVQFNNLATLLTGSFLNGPKITAKIKCEVQPTDVTGWDKLFVNPTSGTTQGEIQGVATYEGPIDSWRTSNFHLALKTKDLHIPVSQLSFFPKNLNASGLVKINSSSRLGWHQGHLNDFESQLSLDLQQSALSYLSYFSKPLGTQSEISGSLKGSDQKLKVLLSRFEIGSIRTKGEGTIALKPQPTIDFTGVVSPYSAKLLNSFSPFLHDKKLTFSDGYLSHRIKMSGPILESLNTSINFWANSLSTETFGGRLNSKGYLSVILSEKASHTNSVQAEGSFSLSHPDFRNWGLWKKLSQELQELPQINGAFLRANKPLAYASGKFHLKNSIVILSNINANSPDMSLQVGKLVLGPSEIISGYGTVTPTFNLPVKKISGHRRKRILSKPISIGISGNLISPQISMSNYFGDKTENKRTKFDFVSQKAMVSDLKVTSPTKPQLRSQNLKDANSPATN